MSRILYLDCFSGISGDMLLGALLDAGLPLDELRRALGSLALSGYDIDVEPVLRAGVSATRFIVRDHLGSPHGEHAASHEGGEAAVPAGGGGPPTATATITTTSTIVTTTSTRTVISLTGA